MSVEIVDAVCPFCGRGAFFVDGDVKASGHTMPPCQDFLRLDPLDFLRAVIASLKARES